MSAFWLGYLLGLSTLAVPLSIFLYFFGHMIFTPRDW